LTLVLSEKLLEYRKQHALESGKELTLAVEEEIEEVENVEEVVSEPDIESINKKADTKSQQQEELNTEKVDATNNSDN